MKKVKKKKHIAACAFMAAAIVVSIPLGINRSLSRLREEVVESYYYDQGGYAIYDGLEQRRASASDLATLASRYAEKDPSLTPLIDSLEYQIRRAEAASYEDEDGFAGAVEANLALDAPVQNLADALEGVDLSEKDKKYPAQVLANMRSEQDKINRSSYNDAAREFNRKLERLKPVALTHPFSAFDGESGIPEDSAQAVEETGIPSPPDAPDAPGAPDYEAFVEQVQDIAEDTADRAADAAEEAGDWADDLGNDIADRVERAFGG